MTERLEITNLKHVQAILGDLNNAVDPEVQFKAWWKLQGALNTRTRKGKRSIAKLGRDFRNKETAWQTVVGPYFDFTDSSKTEEARIGAMRLMVHVADPGEDWVWKDTILPICGIDAPAGTPTYSSDLRAWALYFFRMYGKELTESNWSDYGVHLLGQLGDDSAKVRQWTAHTLGDMAQNGKAEKPDETRNRLADGYTRKAVEHALTSRWKQEIDTYVGRQLVISLGQAGGYIQPEIGTWPVIEALQEARDNAYGVVREQVPWAVKEVAGTISSEEGLISERNVEALRALMNVLVGWLTDPTSLGELQSDKVYETYRSAIKTVADLIPMSFQGARSVNLPDPHRETVSAGLELLFEAAESRKLKGQDEFRVRPIRAIKDLFNAANKTQTKLLATLAVPRLEAMLADPSSRVADQVVSTLIVALGESRSAEFFTEVILNSEASRSAEKAAEHYFSIWGTANSLPEAEDEKADAVKRARTRAAHALAGITDKQESFNRLVSSLQRQEDPAYEAAKNALEVMGSKEATNAIVSVEKRNFVETQFFGPIRDANDKGDAILDKTVIMAEQSFDLTKRNATIVTWFGVFLMAVSVVWLLFDPQKEALAAGGVVAGAFATIGGLLAPFLWDPAAKVQSASAEMAKLLTAFHGYIGRMRLIGLGFAHAYTEDNWETSRFLTTVSDAAGDAMLDSAGVLTDVGIMPGTTVTVPDLKNMASSEAELEAKARGLEALVKELAYDEKVDKGNVVSQNPAPDAQVKIGSTIELTLSMGTQPEGKVTKAKVPDLVGLDWAEARKKAKEKELELSFLKSDHSDEIEKDKIIEQDPAAGEDELTGSTIKLTLSQGPASATQTVPDLLGLTLEKAQEETAKSSLSVTLWPEKEFEYSSSEQGLIIAQHIQPDCLAKAETAIKVTVSNGPAPATQTVPDFTRLTWEKAQNKADEKNLKLALWPGQELAPSNDIKAGSIVDQSTAADSLVKEGTTINLTVSSGAEPEKLTTIPDLRGKTMEEAESEAKSRELEAVYAGSAYDNVVKKDRVISQSLPDDVEAKVKHDTKLKLVVSDGPPPIVKAPDFEALAWQEALELAHRMNLEVAFSPGTSSSDLAGKVMSQEPKAAEAVAVDGKVLLHIGMGGDGQS